MKKYVWDKTNIGENYPGVTSPLTYSFIRTAYSQVYRNFLLLLGISKKEVSKNEHILDNMLGYIYGEVFYNINNWYEFLKIIPGYNFNKEYFETMLQPVKKKKEQKLSKREILLGLWKNKRIVLRLMYHILFIERAYDTFNTNYASLTESFKSSDWKKYDNTKLVEYYFNLQKSFFSIWAYTIVNDFKVMIFFGMLSEFVKKHFADDQNRILNSIYGLKQKPESVAPLLGLIEIANLVNSDEKFRVLFKKSNDSILGSLHQDQYSKLSKSIDKYLEDYGERSFNELKLEDISFKESPKDLISILKYYARLSQSQRDKLKLSCIPQKGNIELHEIKLGLIKGFLFSYIRRNAVAAIYKREEYRIKRGKVFNIAKQIFKEFGGRMVSYDVLNSIDDIYYLYTSEILDSFQFHRLPENYRKIAHERRKLCKDMAQMQLPRRYTSDQYMINTKPKRSRSSPKQYSPHMFNGKITSKGVLNKERAVVMTSFDMNTDVKGKVLVTPTTDPGWTIFFPLIKGIVIEHGGVLSHASIVAREFGIPCIIIEDATRYIHNNDIVSINPEDETLTIN